MKKSANQLNTAHHTNHNSKTYIMLLFVKNRKGRYDRSHLCMVGTMGPMANLT